MSDLDLLMTQRTAIMDCAQAAGIDASLAACIADQVENLVRQIHGGTTCYLQAPSKHERNRQIRDAYRRGINVSLLAVRYALTEGRVRQIVASG